MATNEKRTHKQNYEELLTIEGVKAKDYLVEFIEGRLEQLAKKNSGERKETATQKANATLRDRILEVMVDNQYYTTSELIKLIPVYDGVDMTASKMNALLRPMLCVTAKGEVNEDGVINRVTEKGKTYFVKA